VTKHLLPKIWSCVNNYVGMPIRHQCSRAQAIVLWVGRSTYLAVAADDGNTLRSAGAKKYDFHEGKGKQEFGAFHGLDSLEWNAGIIEFWPIFAAP
jgi:hypothetical protein